jgi:hypothetical protein
MQLTDSGGFYGREKEQQDFLVARQNDMRSPPFSKYAGFHWFQ